MRIHELTIHNVRGIRDLNLRPNGENVVIWGPNGSGKSAVVDAIDFLLTGSISRLVGPGTGDIDLDRHGPHIDTSPEDSWVSAIVQVPGTTQPLAIRRCLMKPTILEYAPEHDQHIQTALSVARRGQIILTRREILGFITSEASNRAERIQHLLNIREVEQIRRALVRVRGEFDSDSNSRAQALDDAIADILSTTKTDEFSEAILLAFINENRAILGGFALPAIGSAEVKDGITAPKVTARAGVEVSIPTNLALLEREIQSLLDSIVGDANQTLLSLDRSLRALLRRAQSDPRMFDALRHRTLLQLGLELLDESGKCPLCETQWDLPLLRDHIEARVANVETSIQLKGEIDQSATQISRLLATSIATLDKVIAGVHALEIRDHSGILDQWRRSLTDLSQSSKNPLDHYLETGMAPDLLARRLAPASAQKTLEQILREAKHALPEASPDQLAWDLLTTVEVNLRAYIRAKGQLRETETLLQYAIHVHDAFQAARDRVLGDLYDDVKDRFVELYRAIHAEDEAEFTATLAPRGAGLVFEVDFYGRGSHAPHALHSEGHQDSMGVCLFLALSEKLSAGAMQLIVLDDVVMSVDKEHRRQVCTLLASSFPDRQFIVTTHEQAWAIQLRTAGVVMPSGMVHFYSWDLNTGPKVVYEGDAWQKIDLDLQQGDVPAAAARLRRTSEQFFALVGEAITAQVPLRISATWDLGEVLPAAIIRYKSLLKKAKKAANSWNLQDQVQRLAAHEQVVASVVSATQAELWVVNPSVHYAEWASLSAADFRPVVNAFKDLFDLFQCSLCGSTLYITRTGEQESDIRCRCGKTNWNLTERPSGTS